MSVPSDPQPSPLPSPPPRSSLGVRGVVWIGLVSDRPETRAFYRDVLGLEPVVEDATHTDFAVGERDRLEVLASDTRTARRHRQGAPAFGLLVDDLEASLDQVRSNGYPVGGEIHRWQDHAEAYRWAYLEDPEGHVLQLIDVRPLS
jgi:catechol-2,3-dioxygenase